MYQALYRKWRPQVFADVVGQEHITTTLMNEIQSGRHSHAYLFTGSRGTGKTTCAKIFAKAVNCEHPVNGDPCNCCETCRNIDNGSVLDVVEIDAASNNGVDNIRDIRDEANFTPVGGRYRVYIIDEVHMLSTGAFNALLKTLEEPPAHVKFILATTEVHKLPATILSRCQRFDFKRIRPEDIAKRISYVADQEGLQLTPEAADLIARLADGALRDALSILDQCIGHSKEITEEVVNEVVGLAGKDYLFSLADCFLRKDSAAALTTIGQLHERSCDMERLCNELTNHYRNLMVAKAVKQPKDLIVCSDQELRAYMDMANRCSMDDILYALDVLGDTLASLRKGLNRRVEMEMAAIRLCSTGDFAEPSSSKRVPSVASAASATAPAVPKASPVAPPVAPEVAPVVPVVPAASAVPESPVVPMPSEIPVAAEEPELPPPPMSEDAPAAIPEEPTPVSNLPSADPTHVSLQEPLPNGLLSTEVWNAIIRETVQTDKALIGSMNSSKAIKRGKQLVLVTDNVLLKRFAVMEPHKTAIYNATFMVLGDYLTPVIGTEEDLEQVETPAPQETPIAQETPESQEAVASKETAVPQAAVSQSAASPQDTTVSQETVDPLDRFLSTATQLGINIDIEE